MQCVPNADDGGSPTLSAGVYSLQDHVRWARCVCEVMREVWQRSEPSAWPAHLEIIAKLQVGRCTGGVHYVCVCSA